LCRSPLRAHHLLFVPYIYQYYYVLSLNDGRVNHISLGEQKKTNYNSNNKSYNSSRENEYKKQKKLITRNWNKNNNDNNEHIIYNNIISYYNIIPNILLHSDQAQGTTAFIELLLKMLHYIIIMRMTMSKFFFHIC